MANTVKPPFGDASKDAMGAMQAFFSVNPAFGPQSKHFWQTQDYFLQEAEKFSAGWFRRRHDATRSAVELASYVAENGMRDPAETMKAIADWQAKSLERLAEDAKDCTEMMTHCAGGLINNEMEAIEETAEFTGKATKSAKHTPV